jgi:hypothetical protein
MPRETFADAIATPLPASGWNSWAPEVTDGPDLLEEEAPVGWLGGALSLLMWGCASVLAVWYL